MLRGDVGPYGSLRGRRRFGRMLKLLLATTALILISASALYASFSWDYYSKSPWKYVPALAPSHPPVAPRPEIGPLDRVLHPEDHVYRKPKTHHYNWTVTSGVRRPDGVAKHVYLINNQFPGPTIEGRAGDRLEINVHNNLTEEGLAMHWHGLHMRGSNHYDGAVGFTQCPIPAGGNFTYKFEVSDDQWGTFWYHSHSQTQRADGLYGGLVIHKPSHNGADGRPHKPKFDEERLVIVNDLYHRSASDVLAWYMRANSNAMEPVPDSLLVNGIGSYNCSPAMPAYPADCVQKPTMPGMIFNAQKRYRLRVVNAGSLAGVTISLPESNLTAIEVDGGNKISPVPAESVGVLYPGQRVDLSLSWDKNVSHSRTSGLEIALDQDAFFYPNPALNPTQTFPVYLTNVPPMTTSNATGTSLSRRNILTVPYFDLSSATALHPTTPELPPLEPSIAKTMVLYATTLMLAHQNNVPMGYINHTSWRSSSSPLISSPRNLWENGTQFVPFVPHSSNDFMDIVINNIDDSGHPFHLHGFDFDVLATWGIDKSSKAWGSYNPFETIDPEVSSTATTKSSPTSTSTVSSSASTTSPSASTSTSTSTSSTPTPPLARALAKRSSTGNNAKKLTKRSRSKAEHKPPPGGPLNYHNPVRRDTVFVPRHGYAVIRLRPDNPGIWMLHCHLLWHQSAGMAMALQVGGDRAMAFAGEKHDVTAELCAA
ncbi:MAG: hypothetical protein M1821_007405 [Bathelium mastoideum]|nr:MAG: hypothetical protein M1821_007405 [Bathelium mastoideum]